MKQEGKQQLAGELRNAADDVLSLDDMEKVEGGGLINPGCIKNTVPQCGGCTQTTFSENKELTSQA